jgi:hypothetical protein
MQAVPQEEYRNIVNGIINNGGFNLERQGNEGRYTRSCHIQNTDEWDSIFDQFIGYSHALYDTSDFIYYRNFGGRAAAYESFPKIVYIPLPSREPNFRRCILHVEMVDTRTNHLTGEYIPVVIAYNVNHPLAQAISRLFEVETRSRPVYIPNVQLVMHTAYNERMIRQMCTHLVESGDDFETFDAMVLERASHVLPDPALVIRANREIRIPEYDDDPMGAREGYALWRNIVYPQNATAEERREMYATFAAEQVNMHRYSRLQWARDYPNRPNPIELPHNIVLNANDNGREHLCENNPADRGVALQNQANQANQYIQVLYSQQNNDERARIAATEVRLPDLPDLPDLPEVLVVELDG